MTRYIFFRGQEYISVGSWYAVLPLTLATMGLLVTLLVVVIFVVHNNTPVVKASGRELSYTLLGGICCSYAVTFSYVIRVRILY